MKILHTADWHLGKRLESFSRFDEQAEVLNEICEIAEREQVDVVIIAGDLFDTFNPPTEAVELFYKTLKRLTNNGKRPVIAIAGNHDSPERIEAPDPLARACGIILAGFPNTEITPFDLDSGISITKADKGFIELQLSNSNFPLRILLTPYANEFRLKTFLGTTDPEAELRNVLANHWKTTAEKYCDNSGVNILVAHLYMMKKNGTLEEEPEDEKPILQMGGAQIIYSENIPPEIQYVALGHLHKQQLIDTEPCPILYSSSPLAYSFSEANQDKYVICIEVIPGNRAEYKAIPLSKGKKLLRERFEKIEEAVDWLKLNQDALVELTIVSDSFLTAEQRKQLHNVHNGIVTIIPETKNTMVLKNLSTKEIDMTKNINELFIDYFKFKTGGQVPNEALMSLLKEVLSAET